MNQMNKWIREQFNRLYLFYNKRCALCGVPDTMNNLEFAHIRETGLTGRGRGRKERYYDIINNLDAYRLMHHDCHTYYDSVMKDDL